MAVSPAANLAFCGAGDGKIYMCNLESMVFVSEVKLDKVPRAIVTTPKDPTVAYCINSENVVVLQVRPDSLLD